MTQSRKILYRILLLFVAFLFSYLSVSATATGNHPILIISSYNPDAQSTSRNISDFMDEFKHLGGKSEIALENMNCKSFSEAPLWKQRMAEILRKYHGDEKPSLIILMGQEAWASYLSLEESERCDAPLMTALASRNVVRLPDSDADLKTWMPESLDFFEDFANFPIKSGFMYEYDVAFNIEMIKKLYPNTTNIAFVSDNSYGGVTLQAHVVQEMKRFPNLNLLLLDGRVNTIYTISDKLHSLPPNTALLMGTWRVDMNDGYFMRNATYAMMEAAPNLPVFSITSVGIGYWAVGGMVPTYRAVGKDMARKALELFNNLEEQEIEIISNEVVMDDKIVKEKELDISFISHPIRFVNVAPSLYEQYKYQIWFVSGIVFILLIGLFVSLYFYYHTKVLKDELELSQGALRDSKERAEESNRLKSAFLANMSHEIRTPLNAIVGFSDVLSGSDVPADEQRGYFDIIKTNSDLLLRLINDILDVSRLEADSVSFAMEKFDVVQVCRQVLTSVMQARRTTNQMLFESELECLEIRTDIQRLQQVIINLLSNADKFTKQGLITLKLELDENGRMAVFSVSDTGCGIPSEKQKTVFERFEKLNEYAQGTGLGLSICKLIVEKWGGDIWIDSEYSGGARFVFTHPLEL